MSKTQSNPTPALPLSREGANTPPEFYLSGEGVIEQEAGVSNKTQTMAHSAPPPEKGEAGRGLKKQSKPQLHNLKYQQDKRRELRKNPTEPEKRFWSWVRGKQLGTKFRRQHGIGNYIVDFYCAEVGLVIELDGDSHFTENAKKYDSERTAFLQSKGFKVVRFTNSEVMQNKEGVLHSVVACLESLKDINQ
jgi:very-short-patch-repair endonuclease